MQFSRHGETYGGSPQVMFVCHTCRSQTWKRAVDPNDPSQYNLVRG
jgi:hypothetical protein